MTDSGHQNPPEPSPEPQPNPRQLTDSPLECRPNLAVPVGALLIIISFFLPWVYLGHAGVSGFQLALEAGPATALLERFEVYTDAPNHLTRPLLAIPLMGLAVIMLDLTAGKRVATRIVSRTLIFVTGLFITGAFGYVGCTVVVVHPAPALWTTFSGGLLIALGSVFDVARGT